MKKLGVIGGAGPLASALFYATLVHECYRLKRSLPEMLLLNFPFNRGLTPEDSAMNGSIISKELTYCIQSLEKGGATLGLLICNTLHLELAKLEDPELRFLSIPELVLKDAAKQKSRRLLLLATQNTCNSMLYKQSSCDIVCPIEPDQIIIDNVIDRILDGNIQAADSLAIEKILQKYVYHVEGVILGCTDLPVLHHHHPIRFNKPIYDSVKIPAQTILRLL